MNAVTIHADGIEVENDYRDALIRTRHELAAFCEQYPAETRSPEQWEEFFDRDANAVWLEDTLIKIQRARNGSRSKRRSRTIWEKTRAGGEWEE